MAISIQGSPQRIDPPGGRPPTPLTDPGSWLAAFATQHSWIGSPVGNRQAAHGGYVQQYQNATDYSRGPVIGETCEVHGSIRDRYNQLGGPAGFLGWPTTDETGTADGQGRFNDFEHGSIYWHPRLAAFEVHGAIHAKWSSLGRENFGYPITDETGTPDTIGRFNHFRVFLHDGSSADASIYWTPDSGPCEVHGAIRASWAKIGWETSFLGYPISDEHDGENHGNRGRQSDFVNGGIFWTVTNGAEVVPQCVRVDVPSIVFRTGVSVGGFGRLDVFSDGTTHFSGHLHDSGYPSYDCLVVFVVKDADNNAYASSHSGQLYGSDESGSRDLDWDDWGNSDDIRRNWSKIWSGATWAYNVDVTSDLLGSWSPQKIVDYVIAVVGIVLAVIALPTGGSNKSADPNYIDPQGCELPGECDPQAGTGAR